MATEIKMWQIIDGKLEATNTDLENEGITEPYDLEPWIYSNPTIIGSDIAVIGRQVACKSGKIDLLAIDGSGNIVIIELKRGMLPREALAQAIDYASAAAAWSIEKISEITSEHRGKTLEELFGEEFPDVDVENLNFNNTQRIVLVGFSVESSLERMIDWLSNGFGVNINAVVLNYTKTSSGDELLAKTSIISEELEKERVQKKKFQIQMSDEPGSYEESELVGVLRGYLSKDTVTSQRIRDVLLPALLRSSVVTREQLKQELANHDSSIEASKAGSHLTTISVQLGLQKNDFLRQIIAYEYPTYAWEKDNFSLREGCREVVETLLAELNGAPTPDS